MKVSISIADNHDPLATGSLYGWFRQNRDLADSGKVSLSTQEGTGAMGAFEVIDVALTQLMGIGALFMAFRSWRDSRPSPPPIHLTIGGVEITVKDTSPESLAAAERAIRALWPQGTDDHAS